MIQEQEDPDLREAYPAHVPVQVDESEQVLHGYTQGVHTLLEFS